MGGVEEGMEVVEADMEVVAGMEAEEVMEVGAGMEAEEEGMEVEVMEVEDMVEVVDIVTWVE
jgi:hypothetical protein